MSVTDKHITERQAHIDLSTPCQFVEGIQRHGCRVAKKNLSRYLGISPPTGYHIHCCHLCEHHSKTQRPCVNPQHLYFGTASENYQDKDPEAKKRGGKISVSILYTCPHCGLSGKGSNMKRYHFDKCRVVSK